MDKFNINVYTLKVFDLDIQVIRKDIKNLHLGVYPPSGKVRVATPLNVSDDSIKLYVLSKISWIKKHKQSFIEQQRYTKFDYIYRESHYFLGKRYLLKVNQSNINKISIINKKYINMSIKSIYLDNLEYKQNLINKWYRSELQTILASLIIKWQNITGIKVNEICIKKMKTKWGSCNLYKKRIWLNSELIKYPIPCIEYIILHEMLHIVERLHNENFNMLLDKYMPTWKTYKDKLNEKIFI